MTAFLDALNAAVAEIAATSFDTRDGQVVPQTQNVGYDQAVELDATWLYTDMLDSSGLVGLSPQATVGKVIRLFLDTSVRIMSKNGGEIRSFDGDRVMAIFIGDGRQDAAVKAAMQIKWACNTVLQPVLAKKYKSVRDGLWKVCPASGVASGKALVVRGGVRRKDNDLVSIGVAPNLAAKLSDHRSQTESRHVRVDDATYEGLTSPYRVSNSGGKSMWNGPYVLSVAGESHNYRYSTYTMQIK